jgi:2'-5' RNA ligase
MHGLVSLLPEPYYTRVTSIWSHLEDRCDLDGIKVTPFPHFSWQIGESYSSEALEQTMRKISAETRPFTIRTTGLGIFTGNKPVIYIPVVKSPSLVNLHQKIWYAFFPIGKGIAEYYNPELWIPHISLAYDDVNPECIGSAIQEISSDSYNWEMTIDNIAFISEPEGTIGKLQYRFEFSG